MGPTGAPLIVANVNVQRAVTQIGGCSKAQLHNATDQVYYLRVNRWSDLTGTHILIGDETTEEDRIDNLDKPLVMTADALLTMIACMAAGRTTQQVMHPMEHLPKISVDYEFQFTESHVIVCVNDQTKGTSCSLQDEKYRGAAREHAPQAVSQARIIPQMRMTNGTCQVNFPFEHRRPDLAVSKFISPEEATVEVLHRPVRAPGEHCRG